MTEYGGVKVFYVTRQAVQATLGRRIKPFSLVNNVYR
jgi:hypothetical protein